MQSMVVNMQSGSIGSGLGEQDGKVGESDQVWQVHSSHSNWQGGDADQEERYFLIFLNQIFGSGWPLFGPLWPSAGLPGLRFNSLHPQESGSNAAETDVQLKL